MTDPSDLGLGKFTRFARDWGPLFVLIFTIGVAWATINARVDQKLDAIRYVADSLHRDAAIARTDAELQLQAIQLQSAVNRLSQLLCYQNPNPACR